MDNKIAILVDSGTDVPENYVKDNNIYVLPLIVAYAEEEYRDKIDITPEEIYKIMESGKIPKTSLPNLEDISNTFRQIEKDGYNKVVAVTISSGLSGTWNAVRMIAEDFPLDTIVIDTKNIGIGAGMTAMRVVSLIQDGVPFEELEKRLNQIASATKVFFCVDTLEYLRKGGRIGLVTSVIGSALNLKPIISCNEDGIYYTVAKARGRKLSLKKAVEEAMKYAGDGRYNLAVVNGKAEEEADRIVAGLKDDDRINRILTGQISPALVVHTGPGLIAIGIQRL